MAPETKRDAVNPLHTDGDREVRGARVVVGTRRGPFKLLPSLPKKPREKRDRHARTRVAFFRYSYYDIAFKFFVEHVLDADFVALPKPTKRTIELGSRHSSDMVCAPFKHILGDYIEALELGAEAIMDLSNTGKTHAFRSALIEKSPAMIGTVPMYDAIGYLEKPLITITVEDFLDVVRAHAEDGVDFVTIHAGMNRRTIESFRETGRLTNIVSRGGSLIFAWMEATGNENPFYEFYDEVLAILHEHDVTISLGDAMRPGSTYDATDAGQIAELIEIGKLTKRAWDAGVQVMVEGPGHMALDEIAANMKLEKRLCHDAPFYVLGPLVTDIAPGYDHITAAIGGAVAAASGADFLCYVTPAEHLRLPDAADVREGLVATKIAAHAADIARGVPGARDRDNRMSDARRRVDWEGMFAEALDPVKARRYFESAPPSTDGTCTMCGEMCAMRTVNTIMDGLTVDLGKE